MKLPAEIALKFTHSDLTYEDEYEIIVRDCAKTARQYAIDIDFYRETAQKFEREILARYGLEPL